MPSAPQQVQDVVYGDAPLRGMRQDLQCDLYLPATPNPPLFVWFHGGGFMQGHFRKYICRLLGKHLSRNGIAVASVGYRLKAQRADLSDQVLAHLDPLAPLCNDHLRPNLTGQRALAAMEDGMMFLGWADANAAQFGWSERRILGGGSAGAITAFNMAFVAPHMGYAAPKPEGIFAASGGFAFPTLVNSQATGRVLAMHNPSDERVPIEGVRHMKTVLGPQMDLIESPSMVHGRLGPFADERPRQSLRRVAGFVHGLTASDPNLNSA